MELLLIVYAESKKEVTKLLNEDLKHAKRRDLDVRLRTRPKILEKPEKDIHDKIWPEGFYKAYAWVHT
ncbi:MAG: hypothetical protein IMZ63_00805 [Actinobacteria bacterium]|nr:hypothetical protein [Actinomycetota bacterium]